MTIEQLQRVLLTDLERALVYNGACIDVDLWAMLSVRPRDVHARVVVVSNPCGQSHAWLNRMFLEES